MKHSPSPFRVGGAAEDEFVRLVDADGCTVADVHLPVRMDGNTDRSDTQLANTRLLVSAPDLLNACRQAVASCECRGTGKWHTSCTLCGDSTFDHHCNDEIVSCDRKWCVAAREAIARAGGAA